MNFFWHFSSSFFRIKPIFAAKNGVKPIGIYIFLAKDLDMSKKSCNFARRFVRTRVRRTAETIENYAKETDKTTRLYTRRDAFVPGI